MKANELVWAFLVLEEHPYGREMLAQLLAADFVPALVVEERSAAAGLERGKFLQRIAGQRIPPTIDELLAAAPVRRAFVESHNDAACEALMADLGPELIVLGGTRILKPRIFEHARAATLNSHPGLLPELRGSASVAWAVHLDMPVGCTCHLIESGIDTGAIVGRREIAVHRGDTYQRLCSATAELSGTLMREAMQRHVAGVLESRPQAAGEPARKNMLDELVAGVERKLAEGRYAHFVD